ncbi:MAG: M20 family metallopeptidase [Alphaproteobacteria bacterium]|nr:M20 family metallopeptidase [Alphaproteobacteria bacterium]
MQLLEVIEKLISFETVAGHLPIIEKCLQYVREVLSPSGALVDICYDEKESPVIFARNVETDHFDVLVLGHLDVVPADEKMFSAVLKDGLLYGRGALDMKSFAAVAMKSMEMVQEEKLPIKFGFILSTDEEVGSKSLEAFLKKRPDLKADIVLDNDVGGDITKIVARCKNPVFVRLKAKGVAAHGSTPWYGQDANEALIKTWQNIRQFYKAFDLKTGKPQNTWIDTAHLATISGGKVSNVISDEATALIDFRLTETSSVEDLKKRLESLMEDGVSFEVEMQSIAVVTDEKNEAVLSYKKTAEEVIGQKIEFEYIGGATDSRAFYERGATLIMHSGTGDGMHAPGEYVVFQTVEQVAEIQARFLRKLAGQK